MRILPFAAAMVLAASCYNSNVYLSGNGVALPLAGDSGARALRLSAVSETVVRLEISALDSFPQRRSLVIEPQAPFSGYKARCKKHSVSLETSSLKVTAGQDGSVRLRDKVRGRTLLRSLGECLSMRPVTVEGKTGYAWSVVFSTGTGEPLYGLGQQQTLELDHRGSDEDLYQYNTKISLPFIAGDGWAMLWDSYSQGRWGNPECLQLGEVFKLYDKDGKSGSLTGSYFIKDAQTPFVRNEDSLFFENELAVKKLPPLPLKGARVEYDGYLEAPRTGDYHFILYYAGYQKLSLGGEELVSERWRAAWNPNSYRFTAHMSEGEKVPLHLEWLPDGDVSYLGLRVSPLYAHQDDITISAEMDPEIDIYLIAGERHDDLIASYRRLTGRARLIPRWALGFWQSREPIPATPWRSKS